MKLQRLPTLPFFLALALLIEISSNVPLFAYFSSDSAGTAAAQFLKLGADARSAGMGQAAAAIAEDASSIYWNPAGLAGLREFQVQFSHAFFLQSTSHDFIGIALPLERILGELPTERRARTLGGLGFGVLYTSVAPLDETDRLGNPTGGSLHPADLAAMTSWGFSILSRLDLGVTLKYVQSKIASTARTAAGDAGARLRLDLFGMPWWVSLTAHNMGGRLTYFREAEPLPLAIRLGQGLEILPELVFALDANFPRDNRPHVNLGMEYMHSFQKTYLAGARVGYTTQASPSQLGSLAGLSFGAGFGLNMLRADYAWSAFGHLGDSHRVTVSLRF